MFETRRELAAAVSNDRTTCTRLHFARDANEKSCPVIYASIRSPLFRRPMICTFLSTTSCSRRQKKMTRLIDVCGPIKPRCLLIQQRSGGPGSRHGERGKTSRCFCLYLIPAVKHTSTSDLPQITHVHKTPVHSLSGERCN